MANIIIAQFLFLESEDPDKDIMLYINCPGGVGDRRPGDLRHDAVRALPTSSTICLGMAASMGAVLLAAGAKGKRYALPNARIMIHQPLRRRPRSGHGHRDPGPRDPAPQGRRSTRSSPSTPASRCEQIAKDIDRDFYMSPQEAKEYGLIDEVISREERPARAAEGQR